MSIQQFLVIAPKSGVIPTDDFLFNLAMKLLQAETPGSFEIAVSAASNGFIGAGINLAQAINPSLPNNPKARGMALFHAKPLILELLRKIYVCDVKAVLSDTLVVKPSDPILNDFVCIDGSFLTNVIYARHPADSKCFISVANFHSYLLQEKRAEFFQLASSLGAKEIRLIDSDEHHSNLYGNTAFDEPTNAMDVRADFQAKKDLTNKFTLSASFEAPGTLPAIPKRLRWLKQEPLWQAMAEARTQSWVSRFLVRFTYAQDFNVNLSLVTNVANLGFSAGGSFSSIQKVDQEYMVEFFPRNSYSAK